MTTCAALPRDPTFVKATPRQSLPSYSYGTTVRAQPRTPYPVSKTVEDLAAAIESPYRPSCYSDIVPPVPSVSAAKTAAALTESARTGFTSKETLLLFDWDDTVLPTTFLREHALVGDEKIMSSKVREELDEIAESAVRMLEAAKKHGTVIFVTNAQVGWIEFSCKKYLPGLWATLSDGVKLHSARSTYEPHGLTCPFEWKFLAFAGHISSHFKNEPEGSGQNVVSIGDSLYEREALLRVARERELHGSEPDNLRTKCVKLVETPTIPQLIQEHNLIADNLAEFVHHAGNLQLCVGN